MRVEYILLVEAMSMSSDGALSVLGIFDSLTGPGFPFRVPFLNFVMSLSFNPKLEDISRDELEISLYYDGESLSPILKAPFKPQVPRVSPAIKGRAAFFVPLPVEMLELTKAGLLNLEVKINNKTNYVKQIEVVGLAGLNLVVP